MHERLVKIDRSRAAQYMQLLMVGAEILGGGEHVSETLSVVHATNRAGLRSHRVFRFPARDGGLGRSAGPGADEDGTG